jgi:hypothetical protein
MCHTALSELVALHKRIAITELMDQALYTIYVYVYVYIHGYIYGIYM